MRSFPELHEVGTLSPGGGVPHPRPVSVTSELPSAHEGPGPMGRRRACGSPGTVGAGACAKHTPSPRPVPLLLTPVLQQELGTRCPPPSPGVHTALEHQASSPLHVTASLRGHKGQKQMRPQSFLTRPQPGGPGAPHPPSTQRWTQRKDPAGLQGPRGACPGLVQAAGRSWPPL